MNSSVPSASKYSPTSPSPRSNCMEMSISCSYSNRGTPWPLSWNSWSSQKNSTFWITIWLPTLSTTRNRLISTWLLTMLSSNAAGSINLTVDWVPFLAWCCTPNMWSWMKMGCFAAATLSTSRWNSEWLTVSTKYYCFMACSLKYTTKASLIANRCFSSWLPLDFWIPQSS